ncbi:uncharacterized protein [Miscanthus floridulus]|uniref:uncharacterized protein n=1 Tax=Miscanthus floridulus TaxID=154761 RepID=UPI0034588BA3
MTALVGAKVPPRVKFFFWLALHGRLWTAERRMRHGLQQDTTCIICDQQDETTDHLLASCVFTHEVWHRLLSREGFMHLVPSDDSRLADWWQNTRSSIPKHFRRSFDSLVLLVSWMVWKERNRRTFDKITKTPSQLVALILEEADAWIAACFRCLASRTALAV